MRIRMALMEEWNWDVLGLTILDRNFLTRSYPTMKKHNPHTPILIREANGTEPTLYARFGASCDIEQTVTELILIYRLWKGEEATVEGSGRQGDRATSHGAGAVEDIGQEVISSRQNALEE